jgi:hypothetical protein
MPTKTSAKSWETRASETRCLRLRSSGKGEHLPQVYWQCLIYNGKGQQGPDAVRAVLRVAAGPQLVIGWQPVVCILDGLDRAPTAQQWWEGLLLRLAGELGDLPLRLVTTLEGPAELGGHELGEPAGLWVARRLVDAGVASWVPMGRLDVDAVAAWLGPCEPELPYGCGR